MGNRNRSGITVFNYAEDSVRSMNISKAKANRINLKSAGLDKKAKELIELIRSDPFCKPPEYEPLVGSLIGFYSRRINIQHRLVYQIYNDTFKENDADYDGVIKIVRMWTHYEKM